MLGKANVSRLLAVRHMCSGLCIRMLISITQYRQSLLRLWLMQPLFGMITNNIALALQHSLCMFITGQWWHMVASLLTSAACEVNRAICCNGKVVGVRYGRARVYGRVPADVCGKKADDPRSVVILEQTLGFKETNIGSSHPNMHSGKH